MLNPGYYYTTLLLGVLSALLTGSLQGWGQPLWTGDRKPLHPHIRLISCSLLHTQQVPYEPAQEPWLQPTTIIWNYGLKLDLKKKTNRQKKRHPTYVPTWLGDTACTPPPSRQAEHPSPITLVPGGQQDSWRATSEKSDVLIKRRGKAQRGKSLTASLPAVRGAAPGGTCTPRSDGAPRFTVCHRCMSPGQRNLGAWGQAPVLPTSMHIVFRTKLF